MSKYRKVDGEGSFLGLLARQDFRQPIISMVNGFRMSVALLYLHPVQSFSPHDAALMIADKAPHPDQTMTSAPQ